MTRSDPNHRLVGGNIMHRRFAYLHKKDHSRFGLLLATDSKNARQYLGSQFHVRQTWLTDDEESCIGYDRDRRWEIVSSIFSNRLSKEIT